MRLVLGKWQGVGGRVIYKCGGTDMTSDIAHNADKFMVNVVSVRIKPVFDTVFNFSKNLRRGGFLSQVPPPETLQSRNFHTRYMWVPSFQFCN